MNYLEIRLSYRPNNQLRMVLFDTPEGISKYVSEAKKAGKKVSLVPTMGALHEGHLSLFRLARKESDIVVGSIFVNPIQFNNPHDLQHYPRTEKQDLSMLESVGCDAVFLPTPETMYDEMPRLTMNFGNLELVMEGKFRPGHFNGVGIVVAKLFNITSPDKAYFGQKDLQQYLIIRQMVKDLSFPIQLTCCPTLRENDGLAMSSRNVRLSSMARPVASKLFEALQLGANSLKRYTVTESKSLVNDFMMPFRELRLEYFEIADAETLNPINDVANHKRIALCIAAHLEGVRLIDNIVIEQ